MRGCRNHQRRLVGHLQPVAAEAVVLLRIVREHDDAPRSQIREDLRPDAVVARIDGKAQTNVGLDGVEPVVLQRIGAELVHQTDAPALLSQVHQHAASFGGDDRHRFLQLRLAVAALGAEDIAGETLAVHAHQHRLAVVHPPPHQRDVRRVRDQILVAVRRHRAELGGQHGRGATHHETFCSPPVCDEVVDRNDLHIVFRGEVVEVGAACHAPVLAHDLADDAAGKPSGELAEVDDRLGLTGALEDSAGGGAQRKGVTRLGEIARLRVLVAEHADGGGAVECGDPRGDAMSDAVDAHGERGAEPRRVLVHHGAESELVQAPSLCGNAYEPARMRGHEVDRFRGDAIRSDGQVAFVLAVLVVHDDDEATGPDVRDRIVDGCQRHCAQPFRTTAPAGAVTESRPASARCT